MAKIHMIRAGYKPELDRLPASSNQGCSEFLKWLTILAILLAIGVGIFAYITTPQIPDISSERITLVPMGGGVVIEPTYTATTTPDSWSATGTALSFVTATVAETETTETIDYCWFLTPSPQPRQTAIPVTPDSWSATGTHIALMTATVAPPAPPTQAPPRAWCDILLTPTATFTPYPITDDTDGTRPTSLPLLVDEATNVPVIFATSTPLPTIMLRDAPTSLPIVIIQTQIVRDEVQIIVIQTHVINVVVTTTPSATPSATITPSATPSATTTPSVTPSATTTPSATPSATITPSATPSATITPSATPSATITPSSTETITP